MPQPPGLRARGALPDEFAGLDRMMQYRRVEVQVCGSVAVVRLMRIHRYGDATLLGTPRNKQVVEDSKKARADVRRNNSRVAKMSSRGNVALPNPQPYSTIKLASPRLVLPRTGPAACAAIESLIFLIIDFSVLEKNGIAVLTLLSNLCLRGSRRLEGERNRSAISTSLHVKIDSKFVQFMTSITKNAKKRYVSREDLRIYRAEKIQEIAAQCGKSNEGMQINSGDLMGRRFNGYDLKQYLEQYGVESKLLVYWNKKSDSSFVSQAFSYPGSRYITRALGIVERQVSLHARLHPHSWTLPMHKAVREADLMHLQIIHDGYFSLSALPYVTSKKPTVWTWHDPWPMTGHCIHPLECHRWQVGCGSCPDLTLPFPMKDDRTAEQFFVEAENLYQDQG